MLFASRSYVNHLLLLGEDLSKIKDIKHQLGKLYQMKDLRPASSYLGIHITRDQNTPAIWIDQQAYIERLEPNMKVARSLESLLWLFDVM